MGLFNKKRSTDEQQNYEHFMAGYRKGYPLVGEPQVNLPQDVVNSPEYQRGLKGAQEQFEQQGHPQIRYEASGDDDTVYCWKCRIKHSGGQC